MARRIATIAMLLLLAAPAAAQEEHHNHPAPQRLGARPFCHQLRPSGGAAFDRAIALLHSFAYEAADQGFAGVAARSTRLAP